jgi:hypothetical protein
VKITAIPPILPYQEEDCHLSEVLNRASAGEIIIIRHSTFMKDKVREFNNVAFAQLETYVNKELIPKKWTKLHNLVSSKQLWHINQHITKLNETFLLNWAKEFVTDFLQYPHNFYLYSNPVFRTFIPYHLFAKAQKYLFPYLGALKFTSPHRDSWAEYSESSINIWIATQKVSEGNSILFYPQQ